MRERIAILDCDFGDGELEREILGPLGYDVVVADARSEEQAIEAAEGAVGLFSQYAPVGAALFERRPEVRAVVRYGIGLDVIDLEAAGRRGVAVSGVSDYCTDEVADHALALILAATRAVVSADGAVKQGRWPAPAELPPMIRLRGLRLGLLGFGRIARAVAARAQAFGCEVIAYDPYVPPASMADVGVVEGAFEEVLGCDIVSLHLPATDATRGLIGARALSLMKSGSILVNVARGSLVDEAALLAGLDLGRPGWACLDVLVVEGASSMIGAHPRTIATPHIAYYSPASLIDLRRGAAGTLARLLEEGR